MIIAVPHVLVPEFRPFDLREIKAPNDWRHIAILLDRCLVRGIE